jgi:hypothetical protein
MEVAEGYSKYLCVWEVIDFPELMELRRNMSGLGAQSRERAPSMGKSESSSRVLLTGLATVSEVGKTPPLTLQPLPLLVNHCHRRYRNSLIGKVQAVSRE